MVDGHGEERRIHGQLLVLLFPALYGVDQFDQVILAGGDAEVLDVFTAFSQNSNLSEFFPLRSIRKTLPYLESLGVTEDQITADSPTGSSQGSVNPPSLPCSPATVSPVWAKRMRDVGYSEQEIHLAGILHEASPSHLPTDCLSPSPHSPTVNSPHSSTAHSPHSPTAHSPHSFTAHSPRSPTAYTPRSSTAQSPHSSKAQSPHSSKAQSPRSSKAHTPRSSTAHTPHSSTVHSPHSPTAHTSRSSTAHSPRSSTAHTPRSSLPAASPPSSNRGTKRHHEPEVLMTVPKKVVLCPECHERVLGGHFYYTTTYYNVA